MDITLDILKEGSAVNGLEETVANSIREKLIEYQDELLLSLENCESPIEKLLALELYDERRNDERVYPDVFNLSTIKTQEKIKCSTGKEYRVDFLLSCLDAKGRNHFFIVECDGYEFHSNKEKFKEDRARDRLLLRDGYKTIRFSGSEIVEDTNFCVYEIFETISGFLRINEGDF